MNFMMRIHSQNAMEMKAKAFESLQMRLFKLPWVAGVAVRGSSRSVDGLPSDLAFDILVVTTDIVTNSMERTVAELCVDVNDRFGTSVTAYVIHEDSFALNNFFISSGV